MRNPEEGKAIDDRAKGPVNAEKSVSDTSPPVEIAKAISEGKYRCVCVSPDKRAAVNSELEKLGAKPCPMVEIPTNTESSTPETAKPSTDKPSGEKCINLFVLFSPEKFVEAMTAAKDSDKE